MDNQKSSFTLESKFFFMKAMDEAGQTELAFQLLKEIVNITKNDKENFSATEIH